MTSTYFDQKDYISNSEFKRILKQAGYGIPEPENLDNIFSFGILFEDLLLQPLKADHTHKDYELAKEMVNTTHKDPVVGRLLSLADFRVQHEYYRHDVFGFKGRCKTDGDSKMLDMMLELKSLAVTTDNQFREAIDHFNYDRAAAWYINCTYLRRQLIVGVSKKEPKRIFKNLVVKDDVMYKSGVMKIDKVKRVITEIVGDLGLNDIAA